MYSLVCTLKKTSYVFLKPKCSIHLLSMFMFVFNDDVKLSYLEILLCFFRYVSTVPDFRQYM